MRKSDRTKKWRKLHAKNCDRKSSYDDKESAVAAAKHYEGQFGASSMNAYKCFACGKFHVGHPLRR